MAYPFSCAVQRVAFLSSSARRSDTPRSIRPTNAIASYKHEDHPAKSSACARIERDGSPSYGLRASATATFVFSPRRSLARMVPSGPIRNVAGMAVAPYAETTGETGPANP
jgi:hypothetical protein